MWRSLLSVVLLWPCFVSAAGTEDVVISDAELQQAMFAAGTVVSEEHRTLTPAERDWAGQHFHIELEPQTVSVWLSRELGSGKIRAGLIKTDIDYLGQTVTLALGLSDELRVTRAAITRVPAAVRQDFESSIGVGFLKRYTMMSARQLSYLANVLNKEGQPAAQVAEQLFRSGATLAAIIKLQQ